MSNRINALTVALEHTMRDDDLEGVVNAIRHVRGVLAVTMVVADGNEWAVRQQAEHRLRMKVYDALRSEDA